ncbi:MAG TPA: exodeoxyribonuclease VII large subunit [Pelolinea sp.]|nr:exodeoxyribonuclease VII large subunit [Pelolinea sp.]
MIDTHSLQVYPNAVEKEFQDFNRQVYSVSDLTAYIRAVLESNENLTGIWVSGEISNLSRPGSGHVYFTLKDANASLRCVIWREQARYLSGALRDGMAVEAHGSISVYEQGGQYQLYVDGLRAAGEGLLYQEFLRLKAQLEAEGLFDEERKRPIPRLPQVIGVVTSPTGAAFQDMLNTLRARCPLVEVVLAPSSVQGDAAPAQIAAALEALNRFIKPDVIIVGRGGGSLEDLWAFNDERVVRAVAMSEAPVISGVGHETDFTLTDFAADLRAPTPTGAAVLAAPDREDLLTETRALSMRLVQVVQDSVEQRRYKLSGAAHRMDQVSPRWRVMQDMQRLDELSLRIVSMMKNTLRAETARLQAAEVRLRSLDPRQVINRGYALVQDKAGGLVTSVQQVKLGQNVNVRLRDGGFGADVSKIEEDKQGN